MWLSFSLPLSAIDRSMNMPTDPTEQFLGSDGRPELTRALSFVADFVETLLNPAPSGWSPAGGLAGADLLHVRRSPPKLRLTHQRGRVRLHPRCAVHTWTWTQPRRCSSVAAKDTAICCATSTCTYWARRQARRALALRTFRMRVAYWRRYSRSSACPRLPAMATDRRPARRRDRPYRMLLARHCRSGTGARRRADPYRRQGRFSARGVDLILVGPRGLAHHQNASASSILLLRCLRIGSCHGGQTIGRQWQPLATRPMHGPLRRGRKPGPGRVLINAQMSASRG